MDDNQLIVKVPSSIKKVFKFLKYVFLVIFFTITIFYLFKVGNYYLNYKPVEATIIDEVVRDKKIGIIHFDVKTFKVKYKVNGKEYVSILDGHAKEDKGFEQNLINTKIEVRYNRNNPNKVRLDTDLFILRQTLIFVLIVIIVVVLKIIKMKKIAKNIIPK